MPWNIRHEGSPQALEGISLQQVVEGLRDGQWEATDEVQGPGETVWRRIEDHPQLAEIAEEVDVAPLIIHEEATSLDFNALIDVCLVLLIFFILTTSYAAAVQKVVPLPSVRSTEGVREVKLAEMKSKMIRLEARLDAKGAPVIRVENQTIDALDDTGRDLDSAKIQAALRPYVRGDDRKSEVLLNASGVTWGMVITLQDAARAAGVHTVHHQLKKQAN